MNYYNLAVHSCYDLLNSTIKLEELFKKLKEDEQEAVCISDPNMYAVIKAERIAKKYNISLIYSLELKILCNLDFITLTLVCKSEKMFKKLLKISTSISTLENEYYLEELESILAEEKKEVIIIVKDEIKNKDTAKYIIKILKNLDYYFNYNENYNSNFYNLIEKIVYTKEAYYLDYDQYMPLEVLRAIKENKKLNIKNLTEKKGYEFVHTKQDIKNILDNIINPIKKELIIKAIKNQEEIIKKADFELEFKGYHLPKYKYSEEEKNFWDKTSIEYLRYLVEKGAREKLKNKNLPLYEKRYEYELKIIEEMGFSDYFLIVRDFIKYAKDNGIIIGAGRGSSAGSLVCFLLDITEADPIEFNLLFERFLNKDRVTMPDIDIDIQDTRRDELIKYVEKKYGKEKVSQIVTFNTFKSKSAARESARILNLGDEKLKLISKLITSKNTLLQCYEENTNLRQFVNENNEHKLWFSIAKNIEYLPKNTSVHAAGVIIADDKDLVEYLPLEKGNLTTSYITQWTMEDAEYVGLLKIDFLGIRYLTMIGNIVKSIKKTDKNFDIKNINYNDENVYKLFQKGDTEGIFQFENNGIKDKLRLLKPTEFNDIVAMTSLYRPGPMMYIDNYIRRKQGKEKVIYPHEKLEKILKETYGVIVYQEQIMLIAVNFANMTLNEADNLRRAVSKKKKEDLEKYAEIFVEKTEQEGYPKQLAEKIYKMIVNFANYGFNKSHAVVYCMLAYKLAYLKYYYIKYFMTALLNNVIGNEIKINEYKQELKIKGINLLNPDVNKSEIYFSDYKKDILFSLLSIKNLGYISSKEIVKERKNYGKYRSIDDFLFRMDKKVDYKAAVSLVKSGAMDCFKYNRRTLMQKVIDYYEDTRKTIDRVRESVMEEFTISVRELDDYTINEKIKMEKESTGTYFLKHPVEIKKEKYYYLPLRYIEGNEIDAYVEIISVKEITTKKGSKMAFLVVNDGKNDIDVTIFPATYQYAKVMLKMDNFFVLSLKKDIKGEKNKYILEKITTFENYYNYCINNINEIYVLVDNENKEFIKKYINTKGKTKLISLFKNNRKKLTSIVKEKDFLENYIKKYPKKFIKINYKKIIKYNI